MRIVSLTLIALLFISAPVLSADKKKQQPKGSAAAQRGFDAADLDKNGSLSPLEFIGPTYNSYTLKRRSLFAQWDGNRDGSLSLDEVNKGYARELAEQEARRKRMQQAKRRNNKKK